MIDWKESWRVLKQHPGLGYSISLIGLGMLAGSYREGTEAMLIGGAIMSVFLLVVLATSMRRKK